MLIFIASINLLIAPDYEMSILHVLKLYLRIEYFLYIIIRGTLKPIIYHIIAYYR